jgi:hypoxanthine phosphoribosyltransferase
VLSSPGVFDSGRVLLADVVVDVGDTLVRSAAFVKQKGMTKIDALAIFAHKAAGDKLMNMQLFESVDIVATNIPSVRNGDTGHRAAHRWIVRHRVVIPVPFLASKRITSVRFIPPKG